MRNFLLICGIFLVYGCTTKSKTESEIEKIAINVEFIRFDKIFGTAQLEDLSRLKSQFPAFFPKQYSDSIWIDKLQDTLQKQLYDEVIKKFPNEDYFKDDLGFLFQHIKYFFPQFKTPTVVITTSDVDYKNKIILSDSLLILSLDNYLGSDHLFYEGIPDFISQDMKESQIISDIASVYAQKWIPKPKQRTFLAQIIYFGKQLYLKDLWMTTAEDFNKIGFTKDEFIWIENNETEIWRNFVENEYLYNTNPKLSSRFINPAPFSKFYLEIDNESPGMVGRYIGWQIVRSYMENNKSNIQQLFTLSAEEIFNKSKYKPTKK